MLRRFLLLPLLFAVTACGQASPPLTASPTATTSPTLPATLTALPTATATVTPTPFPTLSGKKPYLMVRDDRIDELFSIYDTNGGRRVLQLPLSGKTHAYWLSESVSPDGKWLAFYTGDFASNDAPKYLPITLRLLNIADGTVKTVADVVTDGYDEKLNQVAEKLKELEPDYYNTDDRDWVSGRVISEFEWYIHAVAWSPNGQTLAFAAQMDGLSSDIYTYNLQTGAIHQVEESLQSVSYIMWSPDGKYIVFENAHPGNVYTGSTLHAVKAESWAIQEPETIYSDTWMAVQGWFSENTLLMSDGTDTAGNFNLHLLNIETGQRKTLWKGSISGYAIDYKNKVIAINTGEFQQSDWGLYFVTFDGRKKKILDGVYYAGLDFRDGEKHRFLFAGIGSGETFDLGGQVVGLDLNGKTTPIAAFVYNKIELAPDNTSLLLWNDDKLNLYDKNDKLLKTFSISGIRRVIWWPNSQGIFYGVDKDVYALSLPDGTPKWVDSFYLPDTNYGDLDTVWLP